MVPEPRRGGKMSNSPKTPKSSDYSGGDGAGERAMVHSGAVELPMLTRTNYQVWSLVMKVSLEALGLWGAVESDKVERRDDRMALSVILRGVPVELKAVLAVKKTAKEAWEAVKTMRVGEDRVKAANKQRLMKEFENLMFKDGERVDDFAVRVNTLVGGLRELGEDVKDGRVVRKVLRVVPKKWKQVAVSIEMLLDLDTMTMEELIGRLRVAVDAEEEEVAKEVARLNLAEEQRDARRRQRGKERARGGDGRRSDGNRGNGGRRDDDDRSDDDDDASSTCSTRSRRGRRSSPRCYECGETGHLARWCREQKKKETALLASAEDEPTLL